MNTHDQPEQPTPDSLTLWFELGHALSSGTEWNDFLSAQKERETLLKRQAEIEKSITEIFAAIQKRVDQRFDITVQVTAIRFQVREAARVSHDAIHVSGRISKSLTSLSEKIA